MEQYTDIDVETEIERVCRTCLCKGNESDMNSVFLFSTMSDSENVSSSPPPSVMVSYFTQLKFSQGDGLPEYICQKCLESVTNAFSFKLQAERADVKLRDHIAKKNLINKAAIKEEVGNQEYVPKIVIKSEQLHDDELELNNHDDYMDVGNSDDSEDDLKPLKELKILIKPSDVEAMKRIRNPVPCDVCNKIFKCLLTLETHKRKYHSTGVQCDVCTKFFKKKSHLKQHKLESHPENESDLASISCKLCETPFLNENQLIAHIMQMHNGPRKRGRPSKKDAVSNKLKLQKILETMNIKIEDDYFEMKQNGDDFYENSMDAKLEDLSGLNRTTDYYCSLCDKLFRSCEIYNSHIKKHSFHKPSVCKFCGETFKYINTLQDHLHAHVSDSFTNFDFESIAKVMENHKLFTGKDISSYSEDFIKDVIKNDVEEGKYDIYIETIKIEAEHHSISDSASGEFDISSTDDDDQYKKKLSKKVRFKSERSVFRIRTYKLHKCSICDKSFSRSNHIMRHMSVHNFDYPDKCTVCDKIFPNKELLNNHKRQQCENTTKAFQCGSCHTKFSFESSLNNHIRRFHRGGKGYPQTLAIKRENIYKCPSCNKVFYEKEDLDKHVIVHLGNVNKFECLTCKKVFKRKHHLARHSIIHLPNARKFECLTCNKKFYRMQHLKRHELIHQIDGKKYECSTCHKEFHRYSHLDRHLKIHTGEGKRYECSICLKKFNRKDNYKSHLRTHEPGAKVSNHSHLCIYCGRAFASTSNLTVHLRRHTGEKPYKCDLCDKGFPRSGDLKCHRRTHTGEKPCLCTICGKGFSRSFKLVRHMRIHTGVRPYKCTHCDRSFTQSNDLTLHVRRHTGEKPYTCGVCGERFIQGTALRTHIRMRGHYDQSNQIIPIYKDSVNNPDRHIPNDVIHSLVSEVSPSK